jgi:uncharacterized protein with HEPN domain
MRPESRDAAHLWDMREFARQADRLVRRISFARLHKDAMRKLALERALELLGEAARRVSPALRAAHPEMDWRGIIGQRNIIAHAYGEVSHRRLYDAARERIPDLVASLDRLLERG